MHISYSQIYDLNNCEWRHWLKNYKKIKAIDRPRPRELGSAVHVGLEALFKGRDPEKAILDWKDEESASLKKWSDIAPEIVEDGLDIMEDVVKVSTQIVPRFLEWWDGEGFTVDEDWVEKKVEIPLDDDVTFLAYIDSVVTDKNGLCFVADWKTRKVFQSQDSELTNLQKMLYQWALMESGLTTDGSLIVQIYAGLPSEPETLKAGTTSRRKIRTDWPTYEQKVLENGESPISYLDMQEKIAGWGYKWFDVNYAYRSANEIQAVPDNFLKPALSKIQRIMTGEEPMRTGFGSQSCGWCWAKPVCLESLKGTSVEDAASYGFDVPQGSDD